METSILSNTLISESAGSYAFMVNANWLTQNPYANWLTQNPCCLFLFLFSYKYNTPYDICNFFRGIFLQMLHGYLSMEVSFFLFNANLINHHRGGGVLISNEHILNFSLKLSKISICLCQIHTTCHYWNSTAS